MAYNKRCIVTGAAGFIGSALVRLLLKETDATVLVVDKLTYAGVPESLREVGLNPGDLSSSNPRLSFLKADICDQEAMDGAFWPPNRTWTARSTAPASSSAPTSWGRPRFSRPL